MNTIEKLEQAEVARLTEGREIPDFSPGDPLPVNVQVTEGTPNRPPTYARASRNRSPTPLPYFATVRGTSSLMCPISARMFSGNPTTTPIAIPIRICQCSASRRMARVPKEKGQAAKT